MSLPEGFYDLLLTQGALAALDPEAAAVEPPGANSADYVVDALARQLAGILDDLRGDDAERARRQLGIVNGVLVALRERLAADAGTEVAGAVDLLAEPLAVLKSLRADRQHRLHPEAGLAHPWLFTAGKGSPSLLQEIRRELASADRVDVLVSFITVSGVRKLRDVLQQATAVGADGVPATRLRVLTTTYTGATEAPALDELARLPGCEVRVSLDGRRTRLHAKAWIFRRRTGFGSAYVGSANLSGAALTGGLEWTVKLAQRSQEGLYARAIAHFETLWEDSEFERYDPENPAHRQALVVALGREARETAPVAAGFFDLQPKAYQQEMLDELAAEREHGRWRNLVVAATGTGKTVVAAFDYRNRCRVDGGRPRLLFVAHREEILRQALRTYREVLREPEFGELYTGAHEPRSFDHLFATIQTLASRDALGRLGASHWHTVVFDECHRLAADPAGSRALVFCVSVAHAEFMADRLNRAGLPALCVVGSTPEDERRRAPERLRRGELCALVTVDLYNEGVDLPAVDTLLLLRPTQSPVLFQQQIGRGLRLAPGSAGASARCSTSTIRCGSS